MKKNVYFLFFLCLFCIGNLGFCYSVECIHSNTVDGVFSYSNLLSIGFSNYKELDLLKQLEDYNLIIRLLYLFNLILFLFVIIIFLIYIRYRLKGKKVLIEKNEQINYYNKQLQQQNIKLEEEIKRRINESVYELSQREVVLKKIKESDQKFSSTFYFSPEIQIIINASSGKVIDINEAFTSFFNLSVVEIIDKPLIDVSIGVSKFSLIKFFNILTQSGQLQNYQIQSRNSHDNICWLSLNSVKITIDSEECFIIVIRDNTSVVKLLDEHDIIKQNFGLLSDLNSDIIWASSLDFKFEFISRSVYRLLGYHPEELIEKPISYITSFNSNKFINEKIYQALKKHSSSNDSNKDFNIINNVELVHKSGVNLFFEFKARFIINQSNEIIRLEGVFRDVTDKNKLELNYSQKNNFYETIISSLNDIVFWFDKNRLLTYVTPSVVNFIGYTPEELYKINFNDVLTPKSIEKTNYLVEFIIGKYNNENRSLTENLDYELDFIAKNGEFRTALVKSKLFYNNQYQFLGFVATAKDITNEKSMFERNRQSEMYFKKLFDESPIMMVIADDENNVIDANHTFVSNFYDSKIDLKKIKWSKILLNKHYSEFDVIESGVDFFAKLLIDKDNIIDVLVKKADFTNEDQKRMNLFVLRDVTLQIKAEQERSIRENQFIAISENSPDIIIRFNKSLECIYANNSIFKELKIPSKDVIGKKASEIFNDQQVAKNIYNSCLSAILDDKEVQLEYSIEIDGTLNYFQNRIIPEYDMYGKVISVLSVSSNVSDYITAIKSLEFNLIENAFLNQVITICNRAASIEGLLNELYDAFHIKYPKLEFAVSIYEDDNYTSKLIFNTLNEVLKYQIIQLFSDLEYDKKFKNKIKLLYSDILSSGFEKIDLELYNQIVSISVLPILSKDQLHGYIFINYNDSRDELALLSSEIVKSLAHEVGSSIYRILAERKQIESSENYRMLVETTNDFVWKVNTDLYFTFVSSKSDALLGYNMEELLNTSIYDIIEPNNREQIEKFLNLNSNSPEMFTFYDLPLLHKNGNIVYVELVAYPLIDENGRFIGYSGLNRDITARKINDELKRSKELAEGLIKVKQQFIDNVSHEIRTPLNAIIGLTEVISKHNVNEEQAKYIDSIQKNGRSLLGLINNILDVSRIESGKFILQNEKVSTSDFLTDLYFSFLPIANEKNLALEFDIDPLFPDYIIIDEIRIKQVFTNLISNAIKFTDTGKVKLVIKTIKFPYQKNKLGLIINFIDTGIGISSNDMNYIFEHFTQSKEQSIKKYGGSGLGLGICKKIVETMKGNISVESTLGKGSNFKIIIPEIEYSYDKYKFVEDEILSALRVILIGFSDNCLSDFNLLYADKIQEVIELHSPIQLKNISNNKHEIIIVTEKYFFDHTFETYFTKFDKQIIVLGSQNVSYSKSEVNHVIIHNFAQFNINYAFKKILNDNFGYTNDYVNAEETKISHQLNIPLKNTELENFIHDTADILWEKIKNSNSLNDISEFSEAIKSFAEANNINDLINYTNELQIAIKTFDVSKINILIGKYPSIKTKLIHVS